jgi:hypothetical protein
MYRGSLLSSVALTTLLAAGVSAETVTYSYDELGRLKSSSVSGGSNNGNNAVICYDKAGNRVQYVSAVAAGASCTPAPSPTPSPAPAP